VEQEKEPPLLSVLKKDEPFKRKLYRFEKSLTVYKKDQPELLSNK
jgi:hypothetical protein